MKEARKGRVSGEAPGILRQAISWPVVCGSRTFNMHSGSNTRGCLRFVSAALFRDKHGRCHAFQLLSAPSRAFAGKP